MLWYEHGKPFIVQQQGVWEHKTQTRHQRDDRKRQTETKGKRKNIENYYTPYPKQHLSTQFLFFPPPKDSHVFLSEHMWLTSTSSKGRDGPWSLAFRSKYSLPLPEASTRKSTTLHLVYFQRLELLPKIIVHTRPATTTSNQPLNMLDSSRRPWGRKQSHSGLRRLLDWAKSVQNLSAINGAALVAYESNGYFSSAIV